VPSVEVDVEVMRLARMAVEAGIGGLVCSGNEAGRVRAALGGLGALKLVVPGVRFSDSEAQDQARVVSPRQAVRAGADFVVIGRPVTNATDPAAAMRRLQSELEVALNE
jgi:orotidine-5'-phosphate decarboxylase